MPTLTDIRDPQHLKLMEAVWRVYTAVIVLLFMFLGVSSVSVHSTHYSLIVKYAIRCFNQRRTMLLMLTATFLGPVEDQMRILAILKS